MMAVAEQKNREQRQLEAERWKAYLKTVKGASKPPKSAGVKGGNKKAAGSEEVEKVTTENTENVPTDVAADAGADKKAEGDTPAATETKENKNKKPTGQRRKPQARRKKPTTPAAPSAKPADGSLPTTDNSIPATTAVFTDYQLNTPSGDVNPVCFIPVSSLLDVY